MVVISKSLLFKILEDYFWKTTLNKETIIRYQKILEDKLTLNFNSTENDLQKLRSELFKLKSKASVCKSKGGNNFKIFKKNISKVNFVWNVELNRHKCEEQIAEQNKKFAVTVKEKENENRELSEKFIKFVKKSMLETTCLNKQINKLKEGKENMQSTVQHDHPEKRKFPLGKRKPFSDCTNSHQSKMRKTEKKMCKEALSFMEKNDCRPVAVTINRNGKQEVLDLIDYKENSNHVQESEIDDLKCLIYILDTFNVSNKAYHELSMLYKSLPRSHSVEAFISNINNEFKIVKTPDGLGVQQSLKSRLTDEILKLVTKDQNFIPDGQVQIKISGDGTQIGKRIHVVNVTFTILNDENCRSAQGNYPLCIIRTKERYDELSVALADLRAEVEDLQGKPIKVSGRLFYVNIYLGGDYKFLLMAVGIPHISAEFSCIYCKCSKKERHDLQKTWSITDSKKGARIAYLNDIAPKCKAQRYSIVNSPLFPCIPPKRVVIDHLHMFLRITDKLFYLLVSELRMLDNITANSTFQSIDRTKLKHVAALENALNESGVSFELYVNKDTKKLEYRDLTGPEKIKFMGKFRASDLLEDVDRAQSIQKLWDSFTELNSQMKSETPDLDTFKNDVVAWCETYVEMYQAKDVTPYIHCLRYHVCEVIMLHGNLIKFTQQGLEKANDFITKQFFRASNHNKLGALKQVMEKQNRMCKLESYKRKKKWLVSCGCCKKSGHNISTCENNGVIKI